MSIEIDGQKLPLTPENAPKIRAAIHSLRSQVRHPPAPPRPPAGVIELQIRVDALAADVAKSIRPFNPGLNPAANSDLERASLRALAVYAMNKFRALSRQLDAAV